MKRTENQSPLFNDSEQENKTITIEQEQVKQNFIFVYDTIYKNDNLSADEIAILIKLISFAPTFKPNANIIMRKLNIGKDNYFKAIKGLQEKGYLKLERINKKEYKYKVSQKPIMKAENLTYEYLSKNNALDYQLFNTLYTTRMIDYETYEKLINEFYKRIKINAYEGREKKNIF